MYIPKSVKIAGETYHILLENLEESNALGTCNTTTKIIKLCKVGNKTREDFLHTLCHELIHAVWEEYSISQTGIPTEVEEIIANNIATSIIRIFNLQFKRNKDE